jgi:hypothetical protein
LAKAGSPFAVVERVKVRNLGRPNHLLVNFLRTTKHTALVLYSCISMAKLLFFVASLIALAR